ncbi:DUF4352 domain-containing protein [Listeria costaricensis]|uniref:DUF4352 domain-containing protein n=1 Tax=Listeria costaricensis TaxID=2026604 RepID=UPI000C079B30|nr:DUF4352 domain-containing protein [Listeria costaricensis]
MKKWVITSMLVATLLLTVACSNDSTKEKVATESPKEETTYKTKTVNNIDMKIGHIKTTESTEAKKNMVSIEMSFLNNDNSTVGVGAADFKIKSGDETYTVYPQGNNFGDEIEPNKEMSGKAYFELPNTVKKGTLVYMPLEEEEASWSVTIPEAE